MADPLTGPELQEHIVGHSWAWTSQKFQSSGVTTYYRDGTLSMTIDGWTSEPERGRWRIEGNAICTRLGNNSESCSEGIIRIDPKTYFSQASGTTFRLKE